MYSQLKKAPMSLPVRVLDGDESLGTLGLLVGVLFFFRLFFRTRLLLLEGDAAVVAAAARFVVVVFILWSGNK